MTIPLVITDIIKFSGKIILKNYSSFQSLDFFVIYENIRNSLQ